MTTWGHSQKVLGNFKWKKLSSEIFHKLQQKNPKSFKVDFSQGRFQTFIIIFFQRKWMGTQFFLWTSINTKKWTWEIFPQKGDFQILCLPCQFRKSWTIIFFSENIGAQNLLKKIFMKMRKNSGHILPFFFLCREWTDFLIFF